jgi:hypothetical protein
MLSLKMISWRLLKKPILTHHIFLVLAILLIAEVMAALRAMQFSNDVGFFLCYL